MGNMEGWDDWDPWLVEGVISRPGVPNCKRLAQKVRASFSHPKRASEVKEAKYHCQAPTPPCLLRRSFQLPPNTIFACWDIREIWREKTIAYAHALQYWVEKSDLSTGEQPCWLAKSVKELWEEMSCYLSFLDKRSFWGRNSSREDALHCSQGSQASHPNGYTHHCLQGTSCQGGPSKSSQGEEVPTIPWMGKSATPIQPVAVAGQPPCPSRRLE